MGMFRSRINSDTLLVMLWSVLGCFGNFPNCFNRWNCVCISSSSSIIIIGRTNMILWMLCDTSCMNGPFRPIIRIPCNMIRKYLHIHHDGSIVFNVCCFFVPYTSPNTFHLCSARVVCVSCVCCGVLCCFLQTGTRI